MIAASIPHGEKLERLAVLYDVFFVDQFGVLHDGFEPYPGTVDALARLRRMGKATVLVSNSGKRSAPNEERMRSHGFARSTYDAMVTSGEVAWSLLKNEIIGTSVERGARCLLLTRDDERSAIDGLELADATDGTDCDIVVLSGSRGDRLDMDHYIRLLEPAAKRGVPCLCTNPDKIMLTGVGSRFGAGSIADEYARMGGSVRWIGKPYGEIYEAALTAAGNPDRAAVCCVGDSVEHDIAGGARAGLKTALVRTGILSDMGAPALQDLCRQHGVQPDHILSSFSFDPSDAHP